MIFARNCLYLLVVPNIKIYKMKNLFFILLMCLFAFSCSNLKPATSNSSSADKQTNTSSIKFLDNVSINPQSQSHTNKNNARLSRPSLNPSAYNSNYKYPSAIESYSSLQFKYAILTNAPVEEMTNEKLFQFIDEWYGTKYHYGGSTKDGIDCSAFVSLLMSSVYGINNLPRMSKDQYEATPRVSKKKLQQGDLVFFHTYGKRKKHVTHVGVYLCNNKFVHASVSGVMISDFSDGYYADHYVGAGRAGELGMVSSK